MEKKRTGGRAKRRIMAQDLHGINPPKIFESITDASRETKVHLSNISSCANGRLKTAGHFYWTFLEDLGEGCIEAFTTTNMKSILQRVADYVKKEGDIGK